MNRKPPEQVRNLLRAIKEHILKQTYRVSAHAIQRQKQRSIDLRDLLYVLKNGYHEESKTLFDVKKQTWKYAIRGKTIDGIQLRIVVAMLDEMIVITAISITRKKV